MTDSALSSIAIDAMGGDKGPAMVVEAVAAVFSARHDLHITLVGDEEQLGPLLTQQGLQQHPRLSLRHASQQVGMQESPVRALRSKKDSSMRRALEMVREGQADACVSAGNTGALMAIACLVLRTLPGIDRPAICTALPSLEGHSYVLDLGANVDSRAEHLYQFAVMGSILAEALDNTERPRVGLLNIGSEQSKGNQQVREADVLLSDSGLHYLGSVEGNDLYSGRADVVVSDGFAGNVALKSSEGVAHMIAHFLRAEFQCSLWNRCIGLLALPILRRFRQRIDPRLYNGASLLGLRGIVIKSHGSADATAFANAIRIAALEVHKDVPNRIQQRLAQLLDRRKLA